MNGLDPIAKLLGEWSTSVNTWSILFKLALSFLLSAIIGCERATKMHDAGLRTFIITSLVATGAGLADKMIFLSGEGQMVPILSTATIIGAAILSSNPVLFSSKNKLKGLTTAITLWGIVAFSIAIGVGFFTVGLCGFILIIVLLSMSEPFEKYLKNIDEGIPSIVLHEVGHVFELKERSFLKNFITTIRKLGLKIQNIENNTAYANSGLAVYSVALKIDSKELKKYKTNKEIVLKIFLTISPNKIYVIKKIKSILQKIAGIHTYSKALVAENDLDSIFENRSIHIFEAILNV